MITEKQLERCKDDIVTIKQAFSDVVDQMYVDKILRGGKLYYYILEETGKPSSYFNMVKNNMLNYETKTKTMIDVIEVYFRFKKIGKVNNNGNKT